MTDLELTKACAEAMGYFRPQNSQHVGRDFNGVWASLYEHDPDDNKGMVLFHPLHDDAQAMALVKRFGAFIQPPFLDGAGQLMEGWKVNILLDHDAREEVEAINADLNRAICECVAKMKEHQ